MMDRRTLTKDQWQAEGKARFGTDTNDWKFVCPSCGHVASIQDWIDAGAPEGAVAFSCVGRYQGSAKQIFDKSGGPCNYAGGGLFLLNPVTVLDNGKAHSIFEFAEDRHVA